MRQLIFYGGSIITMTNQSPEAIFVEDGIIKSMGKRNDIFKLATSETMHINLHKKCLMPGFIDSHSHFTQVAVSLRYTSLSDCKSYDDITKKLYKYKVENHITSGCWIIGFGYDHNNLKEKTHPLKYVLDKAFPDNPVLLSHISGHMGVINSMGLKMSNIDATTQNPKGGLIGRTTAGDPNGYLEENAFIYISNVVPPLDLEESLALLVKAQKLYNSYGITTIQDGMTNEEGFNLLKKASVNKLLTSDVIAYADMKNAPNLIKENSQYLKKYSNHLKIGGYKIFLDGSPQGRTAWVSSPYNKVLAADDENYCGYPAYLDSEIENFVNMALSENKQLLAHCNGDAAISQLVKTYKSHTDTRPVIIHAQLMPTDLLPEIKEKGLIPSYFTAHTYYWGDTHIKNLGIERASKISPAKSTLNLNIPFTFHQDSPVLPPNMLETIWCAVNRITKDCITLGDDEKITVFEALKAVTINAAYEYFEEKTKGSIEIDKIADLVILSENPLECDLNHIKDIKVIETYKAGVLLE